MSKAYDNKTEPSAVTDQTGQEYSLNDDRRVRTLSPGALVIRRFLRNRVAVTGLVILIIMFLFSFVGGAVTPYREDQLFYRTNVQRKQYAAVRENTEYRYVTASKDSFPSVAQAKFVLARKKGDESFEVRGVTYTIEDFGEDLCVIYAGEEEKAAAGAKKKKLSKKEQLMAKQQEQDAAAQEKLPAAFATYDIVSSSSDAEVPFALQLEILKAMAQGEDHFTLDGADYTVSEDGAVETADGEETAYVSRYIVQPLMNDVFLTRSFKEELLTAISRGDTEFSFTDENGESADYEMSFEAKTNSWSVLKGVETQIFDTYSSPSREHPLGTDRNGMDMLTRLMYGGRVSLYIGFIVVIIETVLGVLLGGLSGYCGGWVDNLIMRVVDVFYCIPSMPVIIILGAAMDAMRVDPQVRMMYLMLILGFFGWAGVARLVRGQILSLREQEFMTAAEATGIRASRRIFRHLIPNVIPQLIVTMTMSLGSTILTEATLSFLGLGVKFPFASWGNIINDVNDTYVLTNYWFIWIPAGFCLLATVLAFNLVGDGLRDAFDPKMKR